MSCRTMKTRLDLDILTASLASSIALAGCGSDSDGRVDGGHDSGISTLPTEGSVTEGTEATTLDGTSSPTGGADASSGSEDATEGGGGPACVNLQCQQMECPGGGTTSVSGVVNIPSGALPLPSVIVYVPNDTVGPIVDGVTCDRCEMSSAVPNIDDFFSGWPISMTSTNTQGEFTLENVPVGQNIPIVVQVGKWRRQAVIPNVAACVDTPIDPELTRLPRNQQEGDLPKIAITTGNCDALECLVRKVGVDDTEFTNPDGPGRINLYQGGSPGPTSYSAGLGGAAFPNAVGWWNDLDNLLPYDILLHSCECSERLNEKPEVARQAMRDFASLGGRVFGSHFHYAWIRYGPQDFQDVANWGGSSGSMPAYIDTDFAKGQVLADWMLHIGGSAVHGEIAQIDSPRYSCNSVNAPLAQRWLWLEPQSVQYMSFNTPVYDPPEEQCGRVVFSDMHVSSGSSSAFPNGCNDNPLTPQEQVLVFMLFDISSCIEPDSL
jgi:hypothetical protein